MLCRPYRAEPSDYGVPPGRTIRDEIGRYWSIAEALWKEYREQRQRTDLVSNKVGVERWLARLFRDVLGFTDLAPCSERAQIGDRASPNCYYNLRGVDLLRQSEINVT